MELHLRGSRLSLNPHAESGNSSDVGQSRSSTGPKKDLLATSVGGQSSSLSHKISNWGQDLSRIIHFSAAR
jgi:hypothetical protein